MRVKRLIAGIAAATMVTAGLSLTQGVAPAGAIEGPLPSNVAPTWQTNGQVTAIAVVGEIVYIGGNFTSVRLPGRPLGSGEIARNHLAAFEAATGRLVLAFNHDVNAAVYSLAPSADGQTLYAGGDFSAVDGVPRNRLAAFSVPTSAVPAGALTSWDPGSNARVTSIAAAHSAVFVSGSFTSVGGRAKQRVAALDPDTGAASPVFTADADNVVYQIALSPGGTKLYLAGAFQSLNADPAQHGAAVVDSATGTALPFPAGSVIPPKTPSCTAEAKAVKTDSSGAYFGVEGSGLGCFDGTFAVGGDGTLRWQSKCLGATQAVQPIGGILYTGSHSHDCSGDRPADPNAFPEVGSLKGLSRHLLSRSTANGLLGTWYPNTDGGPNNTGLGPRVMTTDGSQLFVGGEFITVNGLPQQGFARFNPATGDLASPARPAPPTAAARAGGKVSIYVQTSLDTDDTHLTVRLFRDGGSTPIATAAVNSLFWKRPVLTFSDDALAVGASHSYTADVKETFGPRVGPRSLPSRAITVIRTATGYPAAVDPDSPVLFWRLGDAGGPLTADSSNTKNPGGLTLGGGGLSYNATGAIAGNNAVALNGSTGYISATRGQNSPGTFSIEAWFKTTSTKGGRIFGFGNQQGGLDLYGNPVPSRQYDKHIYLANDGRLVFGVHAGRAITLTTPGRYNNGAWHHVVGAQGPLGMTLYVDGRKIAQNTQAANAQYYGYWRMGGDNLTGWPLQPTSRFLAGTLDEVAVYNRVLTLTSVQRHYVASGRRLP
ncbi:MAG: LamG domain-containing protein [Jatrophihabitantaceae bacterium]